MENIEQQIPEPAPVPPYWIKHGPVLLILLVAVIIGASGYVLAIQTSKRSHPNIKLTSYSAPMLSVPLLETSTPTQLLSTLTPTSTPTLPPLPLLTKYLTGSYPSSWSYQSLPEDFFTFPVCLGDAEWNRFSLAGANDVNIDICTIQLTDPETVLETIAPHTDTSSAHKYTPHSAVGSTRFGIQGLKGTWMQGLGGTYVLQYFEMYVKNNHMLLISPIQGNNQAFEDLLANMRLNI